MTWNNHTKGPSSIPREGEFFDQILCNFTSGQNFKGQVRVSLDAKVVHAFLGIRP